MKLFLCAACNRHVKDETCPFCGSARGALVGDSSIVAPRMSRSAMMISVSAGAAIALAMTSGCGTEYGNPPFDASYHPPDASADADVDAGSCLPSGSLCSGGPSACCSSMCEVTTPDPGSDAAPTSTCK
jgi:RNA polymerase subunit RPABC4/transcription elongation factor Spt4